MNWTHVSVIVQCQNDGCSLTSKDGAVVWQSFGSVGGRLSHHPGNGGWWSPLPPLYRSFWNHQCKLHHVILVLHDTHWISLWLLLWSSYICSLLQWGRVSWDRNYAFLVESWVSPCGRPSRHWSLQRPWLPLPWDQITGAGGRVMPPLLFGRGGGGGGSNSCQAWYAGLSTQLIDLQTEECHSKDTASWNTFLRVEFVRDYDPNSDWFCGPLDILTQNRQSVYGIGFHDHVKWFWLSLAWSEAYAEWHNQTNLLRYRRWGQLLYFLCLVFSSWLMLLDVAFSDI